MSGGPIARISGFSLCREPFVKFCTHIDAFVHQTLYHIDVTLKLTVVNYLTRE
jgi:hypothetical protein